ncbi:hypothetical protein EVAR_41671_1 [Eumeta japonica]|uniref:Uncharacterized protein n=1 Tax=Eumeta variegata TaxID=151549 RepID=A0A4C1VPJ8_EUMVA|nr:hypothetical protein EVAR_41671_1 [Eumeta japonica]
MWPSSGIKVAARASLSRAVHRVPLRRRRRSSEESEIARRPLRLCGVTSPRVSSPVDQCSKTDIEMANNLINSTQSILQNSYDYYLWTLSLSDQSEVGCPSEAKADITRFVSSLVTQYTIIDSCGIQLFPVDGVSLKRMRAAPFAWK